MGTGSELVCGNPGNTASGEVPVPIFSQALAVSRHLGEDLLHDIVGRFAFGVGVEAAHDAVPQDQGGQRSPLSISGFGSPYNRLSTKGEVATPI